MARQERDYSLLEGKVVTFIDRYGDEWEAVVTGCDKDIGITLQSWGDDKKYLSCLKGPSSPYFPVGDGETLKEYDLLFDAFISQIELGKVRSDLMHKKVKEAHNDERWGVGGVTPRDCPFSQ